MGEAKEVPMAEEYCYNEFLMNFFGAKNMKTREDKRMVKLAFLFLKLPFLDIYYEKNEHIHFLVHGHSSWFTFGLHLVRGPKAL